jgi:N-acetylmuramoyl-L-alanine amidase
MTTTKKIIISAGHSGEWDGKYFTLGKRSPEIGTPTGGFYEGVMNREIASLIEARLKHDGVSVTLLNPSPMSVPESAQVTFVRDCVKAFGAKNVLLLAIHNNAAAAPGWSDAHGATAFVKRKDAASWSIGLEMIGKWCNATGLSSRGMQEKNFNILMGAPLSILAELSFMTNKNDVQTLNAQYHKGIAAIADVLKAWVQG